MENPNILLACASFGMRAHIGGPSHSRMDTLLALMATGCPLSVISHETPVIPEWAQRYELHSPAVGQLPNNVCLSSRWDRSTLQRGGLWFKQLWRDRAARKQWSRLNPDLLVVEGIETHRMIEELRDWPFKKAINIRGSPAQGTYSGSSGLEHVLAEMQQYDFILSVSERVATMWRAYQELQSKPCIVIPNCAREEVAGELMRESKAEVRHRLGLSDDRFIMVCLGSVQTRKGQDILVSCFKDILSIIPSAHLLLLGPVAFGWGGSRVLEKIKMYGLQERISSMGYRQDALSFLYAADLCVLPTREEAMPLALLEAMTLKTPIVSTDVCGIPELIRNGQDGLLFDPEQPDQLMDLFRTIAHDRYVLLPYAENALQRYWGMFSRQHQWLRYKEAVVRIVGGV